MELEFVKVHELTTVAARYVLRLLQFIRGVNRHRTAAISTIGNDCFLFGHATSNFQSNLR